jgi:DnaJ homolog subfamily C member 27
VFDSPSGAFFVFFCQMSHYDILGLSHTATLSDIKLAFKKLALIHHPDKGGDTETFQKLNVSYTALIKLHAEKQIEPDKSSEKSSEKPGWWEKVPKKPEPSKVHVPRPAPQPTQPPPPTSAPVPPPYNYIPIRSNFTQEESDFAFNIKLVTVGSEGSGKSSLIRRFCESRFTDKYMVTVGVDYGCRCVELLKASKTKSKEPDVAKVHFFDLSGMPAFKDIRTDLYDNTGVFVLCFDLTDFLSFKAVSDFFDEISKSQKESNVSLHSKNAVLVGTKSDLKRSVSKLEAQQLANTLGILYTETSAATGQGVNEMFLNALSRGLEKGEINLENFQPN